MVKESKKEQPNKKKSSPLMGMMINKASNVLIREIRNGSLDKTEFLERGLNELRTAYGEIYSDVLSDDNFNKGLGTYREVLLYFSKQRDVSKYETACDKLIEDITTIETEISRKRKTGIVERIAEVNRENLKEQKKKEKPSSKKREKRDSTDYSQFLPRFPLDIQATIDPFYNIRVR